MHTYIYIYIIDYLCVCKSLSLCMSSFSSSSLRPSPKPLPGHNEISLARQGADSGDVFRDGSNRIQLKYSGFYMFPCGFIYFIQFNHMYFISFICF